MHKVTTDEIRNIFVLKDLPEEHLQWLAERLEYHEYNDGEIMMHKGDPVDHMWFISEGRFDFYIEMNGQQVYSYNFQNDSHSGGTGGLLPYSRMITSPGYSYSVGSSKQYCIHKKYFGELEQLNPSLIQKLIGYMTERARSFATTKLQHEKVSALGKLAAGIAHEMNNPASAINRLSVELQKRMAENYHLTEKLIECSVTTEQLSNIRGLVESKNRAEKIKLSPMQQMKAEDELQDWLESNSIKDGSISYEAFADAGFSAAELDSIKNAASKDALLPVLKWSENLLISQSALQDLERASTRISDLVTAIKSHVHMDQTNDLQPTDIHNGIENTLTLMGYKLRDKNIKVERKFSDKGADVAAYVGELNQVWTNLIDNAIYAMPKDGELVIETQNDSKFFTVKFIDNGSGIPPDIISRVFDPFFTTKKVGEGTGIGLDLVNRIVKHHNGDISVNSKPGRTEFVIRIPIPEINKSIK